MGLRITTFLTVSLVTFIVLMIGTVVNEVLLPYKANFFYTHWILGRLTGLWEYDFLVDISIVSFAIGALAMLWVHRRLS
ncbi:MAG: hypothetical protein D6752_02915 [Candidatus Nitrosothermus koennekii]|nr:MAG: hypothetical protein D6752_02915 [Candidatus Nitrosothermus koennekii]